MRRTHCQISHFGSILFVSFIGVAIFIKMLPIPVMLGNGLNAILGIAALFYVCITEKRSALPTAILLYCLAASVLMAVCMLYNENISVEDMLWIITYAGPVAILLTKKVDWKAIQILFWMVTAFYGGCALVGVNPGDISESTSQNSISSNILFVAVLLYLLRWNQVGRISLFPAVATLFICIYGQGRSGVLVAGLLLVVVSAAYLFEEKRLSIFRIILIFLLFAAGAFLLSTFFTEYLLNLNARFDKEGLDSLRYDMWQTYWGLLKQNEFNLLLGAPADAASLLQLYGGNLHNAFFMLHSRFGLIGFFGITVAFLVYCYYAIQNRRFFELCLFFVLVVRSFSDWTAFTGLYDVLFMAVAIGVFFFRNNELLKQSSFSVDFAVREIK